MEQMVWCAYAEEIEYGNHKSKREAWKSANMRILGKFENNSKVHKLCKSNSKRYFKAKSFTNNTTKVDSVKTEVKDEVSEINEKVVVQKTSRVKKRILGFNRKSEEGVNKLDEVQRSVEENRVELESRSIRTTGDKGIEQYIPCSMIGHTLTDCDELLVVFGGRFRRDKGFIVPHMVILNSEQNAKSPYYYSDHVYVLDLDTSVWSMPECTGPCPPARCDHTASYVACRKQIVVFGGRGKCGALLNDVYVLHVDGWRWERVLTNVGPCKRYWHAAVVANDSNYLCVYGGRDSQKVFDEIWVLDMNITKMSVDNPVKWVRGMDCGMSPGCCFGSKCIDLGQNKILVVGGWRYQIAKKSKNTELVVKIIDLETMVWESPRQLTFVNGCGPPSNRLLMQAFVIEKSLIVFGGYTYKPDQHGDIYNTPMMQVQDSVIYQFDMQHFTWSKIYNLGKSLNNCKFGASKLLDADNFYIFQQQENERTDQLLCIQLVE